MQSLQSVLVLVSLGLILCFLVMKVLLVSASEGVMPCGMGAGRPQTSLSCVLSPAEEALRRKGARAAGQCRWQCRLGSLPWDTSLDSELVPTAAGKCCPLPPQSSRDSSLFLWEALTGQRLASSRVVSS